MLGLPQHNLSGFPHRTPPRQRFADLVEKQKKLQFKNSGGFLKLSANSTGGFLKPIVQTGTGCCCGCPQCNAGTDLSTSATATIASVTIGSGCMPATKANDGTVIAYSYKNVGSGTVNGTQTLNGGGVSSRCIWSSGNLSPSGFVLDNYTNSSCTGIPSFTTEYDIGLYKISGFWKLVISNSAVMSPGHAGSSGTNNYAFFVGTIAVSGSIDCSSPLSFSNDLTSISGAYNDPFFGWVIPLATGGTVSISFP